MAIALSISNSPATPPPPPRGVRWIDTATAARRAGLDERTVRRRCGQELLAKGLARVEKAAGGKSRWFVREDADAGFARVQFPEQLPLDLTALSAENRRKLCLRKRLVDELEAARREAVRVGRVDQATADHRFAEQLRQREGIDVSERTLRRWLSAYREAGMAGLIDRRAMREGDGSGDNDPFIESAKQFYLSMPPKSKRSCWLMATVKAQEEGWEERTYVTTRRALSAIPMGVVTKFRQGEDAYVARCEPSIQRDYTTLHSNEQWCADHHQFDVIVNDRGKLVRPWLSAYMDMRSRKIVGWCIRGHDPNSSTILSALRGGCEQFGVPESVYHDNGKDFSSYTLVGSTKWQRRHAKVELDADHTRGVLKNLGCEAHFAWAYHAQSKPIERFFGTLEDQFGKCWSTYCGRNPENKPENLQVKLARGSAPTLEDFVTAFGDYLEKAYHTAIHTGDGMDGRSPNQVFDASWNGFSRRTTSPQLLDLLLMKQSQPVKVTKNGVRWNHLIYGQREPLLYMEWLGKQVYLRIDERDVTRVQVWSPDDEFICVAQCNTRLPANASEQELRAAIGDKKQGRKLVKQYRAQQPRLHYDATDYMIEGRARENARQRRDDPPPTPPNAKPIRTALEDQLPALERALRPTGTDGASARERFTYTPNAEAQADDESEKSTARLMREWADRQASLPDKPQGIRLYDPDPFEQLGQRLRDQQKGDDDAE
jgi:putative transposase